MNSTWKQTNREGTHMACSSHESVNPEMLWGQLPHESFKGPDQRTLKRHVDFRLRGARVILKDSTRVSASQSLRLTIRSRSASTTVLVQTQRLKAQQACAPPRAGPHRSQCPPGVWGANKPLHCSSAMWYTFTAAYRRKNSPVGTQKCAQQQVTVVNNMVIGVLNALYHAEVLRGPLYNINI